MLSFRRSYSLPPEYAHFFACQKSGTLNVVTPLPCLFHIPQFSCSVVSNSLPSHEPQPARPPCPSPAPGAYPNSCPSSRWCHPAISSSVIPFSCLQFPSIRVFSNESALHIGEGGPSIGVLASASVLPMNIQDWFPLGLTGLIFKSKELSKVFSNTTAQKHQFFSAQLSLWSYSYIHMSAGKTIALTVWTFVGQRNVSAF